MDVNQIITALTKGKPTPPRSVFADLWLSWYRGEVMGFHNYRIYNGSEYLELRRKSLGMAKQVCETWANLLMNERCDIIMPEEAHEKVHQILNDNNFWLQANEGIELSFALGLGALTVNIKDLEVGNNTGVIKKDKAKISIDFIDTFKIYPITVMKKQITECAFVSEGSDETNVVVHLKNDSGDYEIHNYTIDKNSDGVSSYTFNTKSKIPWFFILRPNIANNLKTRSVDNELGISIFANSLDTLQAIDNKYDGFDLEYVLGRKRMFVAAEAWTFKAVEGSNGQVVRKKTFDPYDFLFYHLPDTSDGKPLITDQSGQLRSEAYISGLNSELNILSMKTGLGESYYKFNGAALATATQVISENSTLFRNIKKHEILLEGVLRNMVKVVIKATQDFTNDPIPEIDDNEIRIKFDDSIIEDKDSEMRRDREDMVAGVMSKVEYRMKWYGEDEDTAKKKVADYFLYDMIGKYSPALATGAMTPEQFVEKVYPDAPNKEEIIEYIMEFTKSANVLDMEALYAGDETGGNDEGGEVEDGDEA